jgi:transposase
MATNRKNGKRRNYTPEFKAEAVKLVLEAGLTQAQASRDLGVAESVLGRWLRDARASAHPGALSEVDRAELARLRKEVVILRKERDILKKAAAFFARETL